MIKRYLDPIRHKMEDPEGCEFMTVAMPGDIDPLERHYRFSIHLDAELRLCGLGCSSGGGTLYCEADDDAERDEIAFCIIDIEATDIGKVRELLRQNLPELGAPAGTLVQFGEREDAFDGENWELDRVRSVPDPFD
jgi:hypothetical protein